MHSISRRYCSDNDDVDDDDDDEKTRNKETRYKCDSVEKKKKNH